MNNVKIKMSYEVRSTKFKSEKSYKIDDTHNIYDLIALEFETLLYIESHMNIYKSSLKFKINNEDWQSYNTYDYCLYLKNKYFKDKENITEYYLLNKLFDLKYYEFIHYIRGLRDNEN